MQLTFAFSLLSATLMATQASAHAYISKVSADGGGWQKAQKSGHSGSFREVSDNTGWVGARYLNSKAIVCGASSTPKGTTAAPGGRMFSEPGESAAQTLDVNAGGKITVATTGNNNDGFPHKRGHVQAYLARCGDGHDACKGFDASKGHWFKIVADQNGIPNHLIPTRSDANKGNTYDIAIPKQVQTGSYIMRFELIAFGQSDASESGQDQYYPYCGQIFVKNGLAKQPNYKTVKFPGAYGNGNIDPNSLPGPRKLEMNDGSAPPPETNPGSGGNSGNAPQCATMCFCVKVSEHKSLAPQCGASDVKCMCAVDKFHGAYNNCARDNCGGQTQAAQGAFDGLCKSSAKMMRRAPHRFDTRSPLAHYE